MAEPIAGLAEKLFSMSQEEQSWSLPGVRLALIVKRCDQGFARARWGNDKIAIVSLVSTFGFELVKSRLLEGMWPKIEEHRRSRVSSTRSIPRIIQGLLHAVTELFIVWP